MKTRTPKPTADLTALVLLPLTLNVHWSDLSAVCQLLTTILFLVQCSNTTTYPQENWPSKTKKLSYTLKLTYLVSRSSELAPGQYMVATTC